MRTSLQVSFKGRHSYANWHYVAPKINANNDKDYLKKKNYGKVPKYINKIKNEIDDEYNLVREMQIEEQNERDRQKFLMPNEEKEELIAALKKKWEVLHH